MPKRSFTFKFKLEAVEYAEKHNNNEAAARLFRVDAKQIRTWRKLKSDIEKLATVAGGGDRKNLSGQGRKLTSGELEETLIDWIVSQRANGNRVSRTMIKAKAAEMFPEMDDSTRSTFCASNGWIDKFFKRNGFSNRRVTSVAQKPPSMFAEKIVAYISYATQLRKKHSIHDKDIIAMDETGIFFDMLSNTTVDKKGAKTVTIRSTGNEKAHATITLAAKGDGTKLKPFIVFKQSVRDVKAMQNIPGVRIVSTKNGWMNEDMTCDWLDSIVGKMNFSKRMLAWDSYRCHISEKTKSHLKNFNICAAVIPGGCTKFIQAPDVSWNKPFKAHIREKYDQWLAGNDNKDYTSGGNLKAPNKRLMVDWIMSAWNALPTQLIKKSFKAVGLTVATDGTEDDSIHCLKLDQPCRAGWDILQRYRETTRDGDIEIVLEEVEDDDQLEENELVIYDED